MQHSSRALAALATAALAVAAVAAALVDRAAAVTAPTELVFASARDGDSELYVVRADGRGLRKLTSNRAGDDGPVWSPNGRRIAFTSDRAGNDDVWVTDADGRRAQRLTRSADGEFSPAWSPDGRLIVFSSAYATPENGEIYVVRPDGSGLRRLTRTKGSVNVLGDDGTPAFSPDGRRIVFGSNRTGDNEIWVMAADGKGQRRLAGVPRADDADPSWSADGRTIAFTSRTAGRAWVYLVGADGKGLRRLVEGDEPDWRHAAG